MYEIGDPSGPIENGTTYIVRPRIEPLNRSVSVARISSGSRQLLVGPASDSLAAQMNVRSSTRATSAGSDSARNECGRFSSESRWSAPASISVCASWSYSSSEPSHQWTSSGFVSAATSSTHACRPAWFVLAWCFGAVWAIRSATPKFRWRSKPTQAGARMTCSCPRANGYSTLLSAPWSGPPGSLRGTSTTRLNSATSAPSWLYARVWTLTVPRSGFDLEGLTSSTSDSTNSVSPWNTGAGWLSSSVDRFAIALPLTSETLIPSASE